MKRLSFLIVPILLLACICPAQSFLSTPTPPATPTNLPPATLVLLEPTLEPTAFPADVQRVRLVPTDGDLQTQLQSQVLIAASLRLTPFVSFDASW
jgi:hypothetical protein